MPDGAEDDEADETEDRRRAEGEDCLGGFAGAGDGSGPCATLRGPSEPELRLEEAASGARGQGVRFRWRGGSRTQAARGRGALREDRRADGGARFFSAEVRKMSAPDRRALLDRDHGKLSVRRQCTLLSVARSGVYRPPRPANDDDLSLMRRIDELFTAWPFLGSRRMTVMLRAESRPVNRKRVQRLMRRMGIAALGPKTRTTKPAPGHKIFPYLLRGLAIDRPNQVWAADITYVPIGRGFLYLVAVIALRQAQGEVGQPGGAGVAAVEHDGRIVLRVGARGGVGSLRQAGHLQHGPGQPVHQRRLQRRARRRRRPHLDGWAGPVDGQRVHRATVAQLEIRGHLPQRLRRRPRCSATIWMRERGNQDE